MGLFSWLIGSSASENHPNWLRGNGRFDFEVMGESNYQVELETICGGRTEEGAGHICTAALVPEPDNIHDVNAIRVMMDGNVVGYLARKNAAEYLARLQTLRLAGRTMGCSAVIRGGWERTKGLGSFGVKLDIVWPVQVERR